MEVMVDLLGDLLQQETEERGASPWPEESFDLWLEYKVDLEAMCRRQWVG